MNPLEQAHQKVLKTPRKVSNRHFYKGFKNDLIDLSNLQVFLNPFSPRATFPSRKYAYSNQLIKTWKA